MKNYIKKKSQIIAILLQVSIIGLGIFSPSNSYAIEAMQEKIEISKIQELEINNYQTNENEPINNIKEKKNRTWLFIILASLLVIALIYLTSGVGLLALYFAWYDYSILALITLILGLSAITLGSIFSFKLLIKRFFKKNPDKSIKQSPPLSNNKRKNRWAIFGIISAILALSIPIIYFNLFY